MRNSVPLVLDMGRVYCPQPAALRGTGVRSAWTAAATVLPMGSPPARPEKRTASGRRRAPSRATGAGSTSASAGSQLVSAGDRIVIRGAREHNLHDVDLDLPRDRLIVFTGLSGSGKSSLAFDTIYAEGQRRYVESLSAYARQFLGQMDKPDVDVIEGLSPAISIDQKSRQPQPTIHGGNRHRGLRLPPPAVRPHRHPARPRDRRAARSPDAPADRRPHPADGGGHPVPGPGPGGPGAEGHLRAAVLGADRRRGSLGSGSTARSTTCPSSSTWPATRSTTSR